MVVGGGDGRRRPPPRVAAEAVCVGAVSVGDGVAARKVCERQSKQMRHESPPPAPAPAPACMVLQHGAAAARWVPARADVGPSGRASRSGGTGLRHVCLLGARTRAGARAWVCRQAWQTMRAGRVGELVPARRQLVFSARAGLLAQWELLAARTRYPVSLPCDQHAHARELGGDRLVKADGGEWPAWLRRC